MADHHDLILACFYLLWVTFHSGIMVCIRVVSRKVFQLFHHVPGLCRIELASCAAGPLDKTFAAYCQECEATCVRRPSAALVYMSSLEPVDEWVGMALWLLGKV